LRLLRGGLHRPELDLLLLVAREDRLVVEPPELELVPGAHLEGPIADALRGVAVVAVRAARPRRPEAGRVLGTTGVAGGVVLVRQAEVVAELVREHADAAVLGLDRVVADPVVGLADPDALETAGSGAVRARRGAREVGVPPMAPDGVRALGPA